MNVRATELATVGLTLTLLAATAAANGPTDLSRTASPTTSYAELRVGVGGGVTTAGKQVGEPDEGVAALNFAFALRDGARVLGANVTLHSTIFGARHGYFGGLYGFAVGNDEAHVELVGEGGLHTISGMGDALFSYTPGKTSEAVLPYAGAQVRAVVGLSDSQGWRLELTVQGRSDLIRERRMLDVQSCFLGCTTRSEEWQVGGVSASALAGVSYQWN